VSWEYYIKYCKLGDGMEKFDIKHFVPAFILSDKNGRALAKAIERAIDIFFEKLMEGVDCALDADKMPSWRLDELARDENIFWYDFDAVLSAKCEMVKNARKTYAALGTKAGTEQAAKNHASDARIEEWFDYGGEAAHFRIYSEMPEAAESAGAMVRSVNGVKRLSAVLDGVFIDLPPITTKLHAGLALYNGGRVKFIMEGVNAEELASTWLTDELDVIMLDENGMVLFE